MCVMFLQSIIKCGRRTVGTGDGRSTRRPRPDIPLKKTAQSDEPVRCRGCRDTSVFWDKRRGRTAGEYKN